MKDKTTKVCFCALLAMLFGAFSGSTDLEAQRRTPAKGPTTLRSDMEACAARGLLTERRVGLIEDDLWKADTAVDSRTRNGALNRAAFRMEQAGCYGERRFEHRAPQSTNADLPTQSAEAREGRAEREVESRKLTEAWVQCKMAGAVDESRDSEFTVRIVSYQVKGSSAAKDSVLAVFGGHECVDWTRAEFNEAMGYELHPELDAFLESLSDAQREEYLLNSDGKLLPSVEFIRDMTANQRAKFLAVVEPERRAQVSNLFREIDAVFRGAAPTAPTTSASCSMFDPLVKEYIAGETIEYSFDTTLPEGTRVRVVGSYSGKVVARDTGFVEGGSVDGFLDAPNVDALTCRVIGR